MTAVTERIVSGHVAGILTATVYGTTFLLTGDRRAALVAGAIVNLYPGSLWQVFRQDVGQEPPINF